MKKVITIIACFIFAAGFTNKGFAQQSGSNNTVHCGGDTLQLVWEQMIYNSTCFDSLAVEYHFSSPISSVQWFYNNNVITQGTGTGANSSTYFADANTASGTYKVVVTTGAGCIDSVLFNVALCDTSSNVTHDTICEGSGYSWNGNTYDSTGIYYSNNDTLILTVNPTPHIYIISYGTFCTLGFDSLSIGYDSIGGLQQVPNGVTYIWSSSNFSPAINVTSAGTYSVTVATNIGCTGTASINIAACDSLLDVWPGDANHDNIADNYDILHIGIGYNNNGFARQDQSIIWSAHPASDWNLQFSNGTNLKHADCNGNGIIDADDTLAVVQNFGLTHNKNNERQSDRSGTPFLNVALNSHTFHNGDTLVASIQLGSEDLPVNDAYGVAFTYNFDASVLDTSSIEFTYTESWLDSDSGKISLVKNVYGLGQIKTAVSRTDHNNRSGYGEIAKFRGIITTDNINGITSYSTSHFITYSRAVDNEGNIIVLNEGIDSAVVIKNTVGIVDVKEISFSLSPNPASQTIDIKGTENIEGIVIYNVLGEKVYTNASVNSTTKSIDISALSNGIYIAQIGTAKGVGEKRFVVAK